MYTVTLFLTVALSAASAIQMFPGKCEDHKVTAVSNFNAMEYLGRWYEINRFEDPFQAGGDCATGTFTHNGTTLIVTQYQKDIMSGKEDSFAGIVKPENGDSSNGKFLVSYYTLDVQKFWVIDTDYTNYSLVWSCADKGNQHTQSVWILSKKPKLETAFYNKIKRLMTKFNIDQTILRQTVQDERCGRPEDKH